MKWSLILPPLPSFMHVSKEQPIDKLDNSVLHCRVIEPNRAGVCHLSTVEESMITWENMSVIIL